MLGLNFTGTSQSMGVMRQFYIRKVFNLFPDLIFLFGHQGFHRTDNFIGSSFHVIHRQVASGGKTNGSHGKIQRNQHGFQYC